MGDAIRLHDLFHELDPKGERVVSANFNGWLKSPAGKPLDVQGVDYATGRCVRQGSLFDRVVEFF